MRDGILSKLKWFCEHESSTLMLWAWFQRYRQLGLDDVDGSDGNAHQDQSAVERKIAADASRRADGRGWRGERRRASEHDGQRILRTACVWTDVCGWHTSADEPVAICWCVYPRKAICPQCLPPPPPELPLAQPRAPALNHAKSYSLLLKSYQASKDFNLSNSNDTFNYQTSSPANVYRMFYSRIGGTTGTENHYHKGIFLCVTHHRLPLIP